MNARFSHVTAGQTGAVSATATLASGAGTSYALAVTAAGAAKADLSVQVTAPTQTSRGAIVTMTVTVTNNGPAAATTIGTALLVPWGWTITNSGGGRLLGQQIVIFGAPTLAYRATATYTVTTRASSHKGSALFSGASASATPDPNLRNNVSVTTTQVR